jgi:hypothetical protein
VVVALDLERDCLTPAEIDDAGVLAGALEDPLARRREALEEEGRVLVAAVLGPEEREDGELEVVRRSPQELADPSELGVGEAEFAVERFLRDEAQRAKLPPAPDGTPIAATGNRRAAVCSASRLRQRWRGRGSGRGRAAGTSRGFSC